MCMAGSLMLPDWSGRYGHRRVKALREAQRLEASAGVDQLVPRSGLNNAPAVEHVDHVRTPDGREAMRNQQDRDAAVQGVGRLFYHTLVFRIERARGF